MTTHADSLTLPERLSRAEFWQHVTTTLEHLLEQPAHSLESNLITCASNAASLLYGSFENSSWWGKEAGKRVNWAGFYFHPALLLRSSPTPLTEQPSHLLLGPYHGRPACSKLKTTGTPTRPVGVCAASFVSKSTVIESDVNARPGHIACDGVTNSEIVACIEVNGSAVGVFDIDCEALAGFDETDKIGLELFLSKFVENVDWSL